MRKVCPARRIRQSINRRATTSTKTFPFPRRLDLFDGRTFDEYEPAMEFALKETGFPTLLGRAVDAVADVPDGFVVAGFSLGCAMAAYVATQRPVSGVLMIAGAIPRPGFGEGVTLAGRRCPRRRTRPSTTPGASRRRSTRRCATSRRAAERSRSSTTRDRATCSPTRRFPTSTTPDTTELFWSRALPFVRVAW